MRMHSLCPPILEITYEFLMSLDDPDESMAAFLDDAVLGYLSWLSED